MLGISRQGKTCKDGEEMFKQLMDKHKGMTACVLGKGPSLVKYKPIENEIVIGVNDVGNTIPVDYSITTDGFKPGVLGKARIARLTALPHREGFSYDPETEVWFLHCDDLNRDGGSLKYYSKGKVAHSRWLYTCSSSAQPAVHLAWYLGCWKLRMFGIDGGSGYAPGMIEHEDKDYKNPERFTAFLKDTIAVADYYFRNCWTREHV